MRFARIFSHSKTKFAVLSNETSKQNREKRFLVILEQDELSFYLRLI